MNIVVQINLSTKCNMPISRCICHAMLDKQSVRSAKTLGKTFLKAIKPKLKQTYSHYHAYLQFDVLRLGMNLAYYAGVPHVDVKV